MNIKQFLMDYRAIKLFMLMAFALLLVTTRYSLTVHKSNIPVASASACRVIQHELGETCIPIEPKRIIALEPGYIADSLLALGIRPIGIATYSTFQGKEDLAGLTSDDVAGITKVGNVMNPSLEKILKLKPDLILGLDFHRAIYEQLSTIAPTIILKEQKHEPIKKNLLYIAQVFNKEIEAERLLSQYYARIAELQKKLNYQSQNVEVTVLIHYSGNFYLPRPGDASHKIFSDMGLIDNTSETFSPISIEILNKYDADILFIMDYDAKPEVFFLKNPLISSLNAAKSNRAYVVEAHKWHPGGILGLNRMLDDIFMNQYFESSLKNS